MTKVGTISKPEDLNEKLVYIKALPKQVIRGILCPFDSAGYYIVWPGSVYYKLRRWQSTDDSSKYYCPSGHSKPVFRVDSVKPSRNLVLVEGEINAISLSQSRGRFDIISPGGTGNFIDSQMIKELPKFVYYDNIVICVDADTSGLNGALKLKKLLYSEPNLHATVIINLMEKDFNKLLTEYDEDFNTAVKKEFENLGLPEWVQDDQ